jgi:hypothetical protein
MPISRRQFLGCAAGASAAGLASSFGWARTSPLNAAVPAECTLVVSGPGCPLQESAAGYESALTSLGVQYQRASLQSLTPARTIILPAVASVSQAELAQLRGFLERGSTVLFESGAAFSAPGEFGFHRRLIKRVFGLGLHSPIGLWDSADSFRRSPYVDYRWPLAVKVRDFSWIVPVDSADGDAFAWIHDLPVAARRRVGNGTLVFLGSPLGPHLLSGDREAHRWLTTFFSSC